jgi:serine/threonine protein phosphatase PrpC
MMSAESAARSCERLIDLANERGGTDNITAVVLSV